MKEKGGFATSYPLYCGVGRVNPCPVSLGADRGAGHCMPRVYRNGLRRPGSAEPRLAPSL